MGGIEPPSQVWKTCILTVVLHPRAETSIAFRCCIINLMVRFGTFFGHDLSAFHRNPTATPDNTSPSNPVRHQTFEQRQQIDNNRRVIQRYADAGVIHNYRVDAKESLSNGPRLNPSPKQTNPRPSRIDIVKPTGRGYSEPPSRSYNPYR